MVQGWLYGKCVQWLPRVRSNLSDCSNHAEYRCKEHGVQSALENSYLNYSRLNSVYDKALGARTIPQDSFVCTTSGQHSQVRFVSLTAHFCAFDSFFPKHHFSFTSSLFFSLFPRTQISSLRRFTFLCVQSLGSQQRNGLVWGYFEKKIFFIRRNACSIIEQKSTGNHGVGGSLFESLYSRDVQSCHCAMQCQGRWRYIHMSSAAICQDEVHPGWPLSTASTPRTAVALQERPVHCPVQPPCWLPPPFPQTRQEWDLRERYPLQPLVDLHQHG